MCYCASHSVTKYKMSNDTEEISNKRTSNFGKVIN